MQLKKNLSKLLTISLSLIVFSCSEVPDVPICKEITPDRGYCSYTLSDGGFYVDEERPYQNETWWEMRPKFVLVPPSSWAEIKKYIIEECRINGNCRDDVGEWLNKMGPGRETNK